MRVFLLGPAAESSVLLPFYTFRIPAGFPSPAQDHIEGPISLDELMDLRAPHTFLARGSGHSMVGVGIYDNDILIIDRSRMPEPGQIIIAELNNDPLVKIYDVQQGQVILRSANPKYAPRYLLEGDELGVWGVVRYSIRCHGHY
ncbi:LexA family protein [Pseudomonas sp. B392_1p]|uniref:LexA family protein n=1 Tax=Pseudomonas sp. B392_1p TaxID=3457507 RepID=UPI003FD1BB8F